MARGYFDPESLAWKPFGWIGEIVILSLLLVILSLLFVILSEAKDLLPAIPTPT